MSLVQFYRAVNIGPEDRPYFGVIFAELSTIQRNEVGPVPKGKKKHVGKDQDSVALTYQITPTELVIPKDKSKGGDSNYEVANIVLRGDSQT